MKETFKWLTIATAVTVSGRHSSEAGRDLCLPGIPQNPFAIKKGGTPGQMTLLYVSFVVGIE